MRKEILEKARSLDISEDTMINVAKALTGISEPGEALTELRRMCHKSFVAGVGNLVNQLLIAYDALISMAPISTRSILLNNAATVVAVVLKLMPGEK